MNFHLHLKYEGQRIMHLAYVDDLLFSRGDISSIGTLSTCFTSFGQMARLRANVMKLNLYMAGIGPQMKEQQLLGIIGYQEGIMPFRYLGVPLASKRLRIANYTILIESLMKKIKAWPKNTLSYAGKTQLITCAVRDKV